MLRHIFIQNLRLIWLSLHITTRVATSLITDAKIHSNKFTMSKDRYKSLNKIVILTNTVAMLEGNQTR